MKLLIEGYEYATFNQVPVYFTIDIMEDNIHIQPDDECILFEVDGLYKVVEKDSIKISIE